MRKVFGAVSVGVLALALGACGLNTAQPSVPSVTALFQDASEAEAPPQEGELPATAVATETATNAASVPATAAGAADQAGAAATSAATAAAPNTSATTSATVTGTGTQSEQRRLAAAQRGTGVNTEVLPDLVARCPGVTINPGTESVRRDGGNDSDETLRWQASITRTARQCKRSDDGLAVRVGVSGRIIEGAAGAPSSLELPLRVAVREKGEVTYSRLHSVSVQRQGASQSWAFVDENVFVSDPAGAEIIVGFDG